MVSQGNGESRKLKIVRTGLLAVMLQIVVGLFAVGYFPVEKAAVVGQILAASLTVTGIICGGYVGIQGWADGRAVTGHYHAQANPNIAATNSIGEDEQAV